ncbi:2-dehydro-3-deoxyphosphogluconate aldolase/(4S)-4-hydroxy-2-oxoglutarate aldolase [Streptomyces sp. SLBN-118]|uniref:bifunctional 4-hydroxy-2-oxoglutarate aldolase/2-dehydro-3-deoxy-phosphogluconate aldolase n=1 Tax=Streptomyces sp. SLBN-118 TaxID=2768454 RepID=UPI0011520BA5|nr:bifunctional 4-hydroxy-2-oxoglutarate aldolase/2-dehydro-3-deoxy-phosphogluconate aldolase [Streptomyces sp. SLBN-118]TQK51250.1 2-dehydro-3-deoxyphosphogluconate aldolase/(4S)-4-hydroxy-2-oxoglutarate aldolase [Streptomyces sp. SLBN-118]
MTDTLDGLAGNRIVAVLRAADASGFAATARALAAGGIACVEVTMTSHGALDSVAALQAEGLTVGVGSVTTPGQAADACAAGASFVVTPTLIEGVVDRCASKDVPVIMGSLTPFEMLAAMEAGASAVKVFPAGAVGAGYLRQVLGPLPHLRIMATGGITVGTAVEFLRAGALAVGLGVPLVGIGDLPPEEITARAREIVRSCAKA